MERRAAVLACAAVLLFVAAPACADAGIPMIAYFLPPMWFLLLPVIVVETWVGVRYFGVTVWRGLWAQTLANCVSTIIGVPLTWLSLALTRALLDRLDVPRLLFLWVPPVMAVWLPPLDQTPGIVRWSVLIGAAAVMTVVFLAVSIVFECAVVYRAIPQLDRKVTREWIVRANIVSYAMVITVFAVTAACAPQLLDRINDIFGFAVDWLIEAVFWAANAGRR